MMRKNALQITAGIALAASVSTVGATELGDEYFAGKWVINAECAGADAEYVHLRANGTVEYGRRGQAEAVGFWASEDNVLDMELLAAPASFKDIQADLAAHTARNIYTMQVMPVEHDDNSFRAVAGIGDEMGAADWSRCR